MYNGELKIDINDNIASIEFYHPKSNSLPGELLQKLSNAITKLGEDSIVNVITLRSRGEKTFCAGASFDELAAIDNKDSGKAFFMGFANLINAMRRCPKLIITTVQGKAVGGAVGIIAASDYVLAHESAYVRLSELTLGIGPFVIGPAVERKTGTASFGNFTIDTEWRDSAWSHKHGLFSRCYASHIELHEATIALSQKLATFSPEALLAIKQMLWSGTDHWDELLEERAEISGRLVMSPPTKQAISAFKRK